MQGVIRHEIVDEQPLAIVNAVPHERHQMPVMHPTDYLHLGLELALPLPTAIPQLLDSHVFPFGQPALVHRPEPSLAEQIARREAVGDLVHFLVREEARVAHAHVGQARFQSRAPGAVVGVDGGVGRRQHCRVRRAAARRN